MPRVMAVILVELLFILAPFHTADYFCAAVPDLQAL
jgi:hypothetical protein